VVEIGLFFVGLPELEGFAFADLSSTALIENAAIAGGISGGISGGLKGAALGAAEGAVMQGFAPTLGNDIGTALGSTTVARYAGRFIANGLIGGVFTVASGGKFQSGFLAAGVASLGGPAPGEAPSIQGALFAAALGGAGSVLGGGKFANGAVTGAFSYAVSSVVESDDVTAEKGNGGGTSTQFTRGSSATFSTVTDAAQAATSMMNGLSVWDNTEFAWGYYRDPDTLLYGYGPVYQTGPSGGDEIKVGFPTGTTHIGMGHTHADYSYIDQFGNVARTSRYNDSFESDRFSAPDMHFMENHDWTFYSLGTPSGRFLQWTPANGVQPLGSGQ
jgi:hypothetical protein